MDLEPAAHRGNSRCRISKGRRSIKQSRSLRAKIYAADAFRIFRESLAFFRCFESLYYILHCSGFFFLVFAAYRRHPTVTMFPSASTR